MKRLEVFGGCSRLAMGPEVSNDQQIGPQEVSPYYWVWFPEKGQLGPISGIFMYMCLLSDVQPPEGRSRDGLLTVNLREGSRLHLCAETRDDAM